jgi:hypothetical protein
MIFPPFYSCFTLNEEKGKLLLPQADEETLFMIQIFGGKMENDFDNNKKAPHFFSIYAFKQ